MKFSFSETKTSFTKFNNRPAFTLIELLVVIAIIAILAAILFPVFGRARENARRTSCLSNMKQIGLGFMQYTQDYDERMPYGERQTSTDPGANSGVACIYGFNGIFWPQAIAPYTGSKISVIGAAPWFSGNDFFLCPNLREVGGGCAGRPLTSYSANRLSNILPFEGLGQPAPINVAQVTRSAEIIVLTELNQVSGGVTYPHIFAPSPNLPTEIAPENISRHFNGSTTLFLDGHAKWLPATTLVTNNPDMWAVNGL